MNPLKYLPAKNHEWVAHATMLPLIMIVLSLVFEFKAGTIVDALAFTAMSVAISFFIVYQLRLYLESLDSRRKGTGVIWDVDINGVTLCQIEDSTYATIRLLAFEDSSNYVRQLINLVMVLVNATAQTLLTLPTALFWVAVIYYIAPSFFPVELQSEIAKITLSYGQQSHIGIEPIVGFATKVLPVFILAYIAVASAFGYTPGFRNVFRKDIQNQIRYRFGIAVSGEMSLYRIENGKRIDADEVEFRRRLKGAGA